jgi:hypothetical protein
MPEVTFRTERLAGTVALMTAKLVEVGLPATMTSVGVMVIASAVLLWPFTVITILVGPDAAVNGIATLRDVAVQLLGTGVSTRPATATLSWAQFGSKFVPPTVNVSPRLGEVGLLEVSVGLTDNVKVLEADAPVALPVTVVEYVLAIALTELVKVMAAVPPDAAMEAGRGLVDTFAGTLLTLTAIGGVALPEVVAMTVKLPEVAPLITSGLGVALSVTVAEGGDTRKACDAE